MQSTLCSIVLASLAVLFVGCSENIPVAKTDGKKPPTQEEIQKMQADAQATAKGAAEKGAKKR